MPDGIKISQLTEFPGKRFSDVLPFSGGDPFGTYSYTIQTLLNLGVTGLTGGGSSNLDGTPTDEEAELQIWNVVTTGNLLSPYQLQTSTAVQSSPNIIRPLDFDVSNNPKVFQILGYKGLSLTITGTAGAGFVEMLAQSGAPTLSATAARLYADATYRPSWIQPDGYTRTFASTLTANRVYTLPDVSTTLVGTTNPAGTTLANVNSITSTALAALTLATGTSGTAISIASATNITTFSAGVVGTSATLSSLTAGRVTFAGTSGLLTDAATLTFNSGTGALSATNFVGTFAGNTLTTGTYTLTGAAGKTLTFSNSLTLAGTDSTVMTFPTTSATIARTDAGNTFTGTNVFAAITATNVTNSALTAGRVVFSGTGGLLADASTLTFSAGALTATTFIGAVTGHASLDLPLTGGTLTGNLLFTDNTYDIGASGATRPRTGYFGTSVISPAAFVTGTAGAGYIDYVYQSGTPTTPSASHLVFYADATGRMTWLKPDGFTRTFDGASNTASRVYTLPDVSSTFVMLANPAAGVAVTNVNSIASAASSNLTLGTGAFGTFMTATSATGSAAFASNVYATGNLGTIAGLLYFGGTTAGTSARFNNTTGARLQWEGGTSGSADTQFSVVGLNAGEVDFNISRTGTTPKTWTWYIPAGSTDLRLYDGADRITVASGGAVTLSNNLTVSGTGTSSFAGPVSVTKATNASLLGYFINTLSSGYAAIEFQNDSASIDIGYGSSAVGVAALQNKFYVYDNASSLASLTIAKTTGVTTFGSTTSGTSTTAAAVLAKSLGLTENLFVGGITKLTSYTSIGGTPSSDTGLWVTGSLTSTNIQFGLFAGVQFSSAATSNGTALLGKIYTESSSFTMTNGYTIRASAPTVGATSTITNIHGLYVENQGVSGTTTSYGIRVVAQTGSTTNYAFKSDGAGLISFGDTTAATAYSAASTTFAGGIGIAQAAAFKSITTPTAPSASNALLYADTSGGKVRLMAIFPTGAAQQIAIEP